MILELEEVALNAWPSLHSVAYDGWLLRLANGYTRRANSVHPLYPSTLALDQKIDTCERLYAAHGLPVIFKLTDAAQPPELDAALDARGYVYASGALIMTAALNNGACISPQATILPAVSERWTDAYGRLNVEQPQHRAILLQMFSAIALPCAYVSLALEGQVVAVGMSVAERGYVGLFGLAVDPAFRRQGLGAQLVETCLAWGQQQGANGAYLQVVEENLPARALYQRFQFAPVYSYWYRQQPV